MPKVMPPQDNPQPDIKVKPVATSTPIKLSSELFEKRKRLEYYMDLIWKGEYSPKASVEVIWRLFYEPKK
jgi:hypothetical protein